MLDPKMSDACYVQLLNESKKTNDYQVDYLIYLKSLEKKKNIIDEINKKIENKLLEIDEKKKDYNKYYTDCSIISTDNSCLAECNNMYNQNNNFPVLGRAIDCRDFPPEKFNVLSSSIASVGRQIANDNIDLKNLKKKCECKVPKYQEIKILTKELDDLSSELKKLEEEYSLEKPPSTPLLNTACCINEMSCKEGNCNNLLNDCKIKETFISGKNNNDFFSIQNITIIILLIILFFIFFKKGKF